MKRVYLGIAVTALLFLLFAGAFAFSLTLQNLRVSALSFNTPASPIIFAAPMTSADEAAISSPNSEAVRLKEFQEPQHVCDKNKVQESATDF